MLIPLLVGNYFGTLSEDMNKMVADINQIVQSTSDTLNSLQMQMANLDSAALIDSNFVR